MASKEFSNTLKNLRISAGYSQKQVYEHFGIPQSTFSSWEVGKSEPSGEMLMKLCELYKCNNILESFSDTVSDVLFTDSEWRIIEKYRALDDHGRESVDFILNKESKRTESIAAQSARITELEAAQVPSNEQAATITELHPYRDSTFCTPYFRGGISAGSGIFILGNEAVDELEIPDIPKYRDANYAVDVNGQSMEPDYMDGDIVLVSQGKEMHPGDVGIFIVDGSAYIKEMGHTELISRNTDFPNIPIRESNNVVCMGKVIGKLERGVK